MPEVLNRSTGEIENVTRPSGNMTTDPLAIQGRKNDIASNVITQVPAPAKPALDQYGAPVGSNAIGNSLKLNNDVKPLETTVQPPKPNPVVLQNTPSPQESTASPNSISPFVKPSGNVTADKTAPKKLDTSAFTSGATKPKTVQDSPTKTTLQTDADELLKNGLDFVKRMAAGDDPTVKNEFNSWLLGFSKAAAHQQAAFMMNLRSQPGFVEGSGEGTAAMLMLARSSNTDLATMMSNMSIENVKQIGEWNKYGIDVGMKVSNFLDEQETHDLNSKLTALQIEQGQDNLLTNKVNTLRSVGAYDEAAKILNEKYPGVHIDAAALRASDPARATSLSNQLDGVDRLVKQGNADEAKKVAQSIYHDFWKELGYSSVEQADAFAKTLDYSSEAYTNRTNYVDGIQTNMRTHAVQKNDALGKQDVVEYFKAQGITADSVGGGLTVDQVNEMRTFDNPNYVPVTSLTGEDKNQLGIDWEWYQQKKRASGSNSVNTIFDQFATVNPNLASDPTEKSLTMAWIQKSVLNNSIVPDANSPGGFKVNPDAANLPPWQDPETSHYFTTWPVVDFKSDGTYNVVAPGDIPYSFLNGQNYGAYSAAEDKRLDAKYNDYLHSATRDKLVTRDQWFYATQGGTKDFDKKNVPGGTGSVKTDDATLNTIVEKARLGKETLTESENQSLVASGVLGTRVSSVNLDSSNFNITPYTANGNLVNIGNKVARVEQVQIGREPKAGYKSEKSLVSIFVIDGKKYTVNQGRWMTYDPAAKYPADYNAKLVVPDPTV